jgi:hypothetical protein
VFYPSLPCPQTNDALTIRLTLRRELVLQLLQLVCSSNEGIGRRSEVLDPGHTPNDFGDAGGATVNFDSCAKMRSPTSTCRVVWCNTRISLFFVYLFQCLLYFYLPWPDSSTPSKSVPASRHQRMGRYWADGSVQQILARKCCRRQLVGLLSHRQESGQPLPECESTEKVDAQKSSETSRGASFRGSKIKHQLHTSR